MPIYFKRTLYIIDLKRDARDLDLVVHKSYLLNWTIFIVYIIYRIADFKCGIHVYFVQYICCVLLYCILQPTNVPLLHFRCHQNES